MTLTASMMQAVHGRLAGHLSQLRQRLDAVGEQACEAIANAISPTVAQAVSEAGYDTLLPHTNSSSPLPRTARPSAFRPSLAAGVQAAAGWMRRQCGARSFLAALAVGAVVGLTVLVDSVGHAAVLVSSFLILALLIDRMSSASSLLVPDEPSGWSRA
jgi:hypothetical protein